MAKEKEMYVVDLPVYDKRKFDFFISRTNARIKVVVIKIKAGGGEQFWQSGYTVMITLTGVSWDKDDLWEIKDTCIHVGRFHPYFNGVQQNGDRFKEFKNFLKSILFQKYPEGSGVIMIDHFRPRW